MRRSFRRFLTTTGCPLLTLGALGLGHLAHGQAPAPLAVQARTAGGRDAPALKGQDDPHVTEAKVAVAWLGDPLTFSCELQAHRSGNVLHVTGFVPSDAAREQALKIARAVGGLTVEDGCTLKPDLPRPIASKPMNVLYRHATAELLRVIPDHVGTITVDVWTMGRLIVKGTVPTYEDKLAVSRGLRQINGCTCVINELKVSPVTAIMVRPTDVLVQPAVTRPVAGKVTPRPAPKAETPRTVVASGYGHPAQVAAHDLPPLPANDVLPAMPTSPYAVQPAPHPAATPTTYVSSGTILIDSAPPAAPQPIRPVAQAQPAVSQAPHVSTGVIRLEGTPGGAIPQPTFAASRLRATLQQRIAAACGRSLKDVDVTMVSDTKVTVLLRVRDQKDAEALAARVFATPELEAYEVSLDVQLAR